MEPSNLLRRNTGELTRGWRECPLPPATLHPYRLLLVKHGHLHRGRSGPIHSPSLVTEAVSHHNGFVWIFAHPRLRSLSSTSWLPLTIFLGTDVNILSCTNIKRLCVASRFSTLRVKSQERGVSSAWHVNVYPRGK